MDINNTKVLELRMNENLIEMSDSIYLLGDIIQLSKDRIVFRNSKNICGINNAIIIKERTFNKLIQGGVGILIEI